MEWLPYVHDAIDYIEANLLEVNGSQEVADKLFLSEPYLQKGFHVLTGYSVGEYIRSRRLYEAALELRNTERRIVDIALRYGYESQESFTKAFVRFHGVSPIAVRKNKGEDSPEIKQFLPITIEMKVMGGPRSNLKFLRKGRMVFAGFVRELSTDSQEEEAASFRMEIRRHFSSEKGSERVVDNQEEDSLGEFVRGNAIGEYGIILGRKREKTTYMVAGRVSDEELPEGVTQVSFDAACWAVFDTSGLDSAESAKTVSREACERIEKYSDYRPDSDRFIEWFEGIDESLNSAGNPTSIWIPVRKKELDNQKDKKAGKTIKPIVFSIVFILLVAGAILGITRAMKNKSAGEVETKYSGDHEIQAVDVEGTLKEVLLSEGLAPELCRIEDGEIKLYYLTSGDGRKETEEDHRIIDQVKRVLTEGGTEELSYTVIIQICSSDGRILFTEECEYHAR